MNASDKLARLDRFLAAHRERGLPVTIQRRAVYEAIMDREDHPSAEQVYQAVAPDIPQISRMTVHRILNNFVSLGLVAKTCHPGSAARFDPKTHQHHHLVCLECGVILDVEDARLDEVPLPEINAGNFVIQNYSVHFRGYCARCRPKGARPKRRR